MPQQAPGGALPGEGTVFRGEADEGDFSVLVDGAAVSETGFEDGLGAWTVPGSPEGSVDNTNDWLRTQLGFEEGAVTTTEDTVYVGFGLEGSSTCRA